MKNMMKKYEAPQLEAVCMSTEDICSLSNAGTGAGVEIDFENL